MKQMKFFINFACISCIPSSYDFPVGSTRFPITDDNTNVIRPPTMSESQLVYLTAVSNSSGTDATLQTEESLNPGRYDQSWEHVSYLIRSLHLQIRFLGSLL